MHDGKWNYFETTMDGVNYNVYFADYYQPVAANETTEQLICGVYLDKNVDMKDGKYIDTRYPNADLSIGRHGQVSRICGCCAGRGL